MPSQQTRLYRQILVSILLPFLWNLPLKPVLTKSSLRLRTAKPNQQKQRSPNPGNLHGLLAVNFVSFPAVFCRRLVQNHGRINAPAITNTAFLRHHNTFQ
jgi:hypothetical protein